MDTLQENSVSESPKANHRLRIKRLSPRNSPLLTNNSYEGVPVNESASTAVHTDVGTPADLDTLFPDDSTDDANVDGSAVESDTEEAVSSSLYRTVQSLSYAKSQKFFCNTLERLIDTSKDVEIQLNQLHTKLQSGSVDSVHKRLVRPIYPGTSDFTPRQRYRYLAWDPCGTISITQGVSKRRPSVSLSNDEPEDHADTIEVISLVAGVGQRRQILKNSSAQRFNLGAISSNGFALARGRRLTRHRSGRFLEESEASKVDNEVDASAANDPDAPLSEGSDEPTSDSDSEEDEKDESLLEYHPFTTWGPIMKGRWSKAFRNSEVIEHVAVGDTFVAVLTSARYLRVYTCGGINLHTVYLNGDPVALVARKTSLLVVSSGIAQSTGCAFTFRLLEINTTTVEHFEVEYNLAKSNQLVWVGLTPHRTPVLVDVTGCVLALLPTWKKVVGPNSYSLNWTPVLDLKDALHSYQAAQLCSKTAGSTSILSYFWIASCHDNELNVFRLSRRHPQPPLLSTFDLFTCPFRIPVVPDHANTAISYLEWVQHMAADPDLKDMERVASLSWDVFDEMRLRVSLAKTHLQRLVSLNVGKEEETTYRKLTSKLTLRLDKVLFRIFMKALADGRLERAFEAATLFTHPKTFQVALAQAEARGTKSLTERLHSEIESRIIQENSRQLKEQLKNLQPATPFDTTSLSAVTPKVTTVTPQPFSIAEQVRRDMDGVIPDGSLRVQPKKGRFA